MSTVSALCLQGTAIRIEVTVFESCLILLIDLGHPGKLVLKEQFGDLR